MFRQRLAYRLAKLSRRVYNAEFYERITITDKSTGEIVVEIDVAADAYGAGVMSTCGDYETAIKGYRMEWIEYTPDWLEEE